MNCLRMLIISFFGVIIINGFSNQADSLNCYYYDYDEKNLECCHSTKETFFTCRELTSEVKFLIVTPKQELPQ